MLRRGKIIEKCTKEEKMHTNLSSKTSTYWIRIASQYARKDIRKESFAIRVVETWNRLPDRVKLTEKPESFKKEFKKTMT